MIKKKYFAFLIGFLLLISVPFVLSANAVTLDAPAADDVVSGLLAINSTLDTNSGTELSNATFYYRIDNGGTPTAWVQIGSQVINTTVNQIAFNTTFDTTGIVDTINITFNVTITDMVGASTTTDSSITVSIDNGNPTATLSSASLAADTNLDPATTFTIAVDADNTIGIENCTVWFDTTSASSITAVGEACSATYTCNSFAMSANSYPAYKVQVFDDNADQTNTSSRSVTCRGTGGGYNPVDFPDVTEDVEDEVSIPSDAEENFITRFFSNIINWFRNLF